MKVSRIGGFGGPIHVFPDEPFAKSIAGPFDTEAAARCWVAQALEATLKGDKAEIWGKIAALLPPPTDFGLELALIGFIAHGVPYEKLLRYVPRRSGQDRRHVDRRMLAAGEPELA